MLWECDKKRGGIRQGNNHRAYKYRLMVMGFY